MIRQRASLGQAKGFGNKWRTFPVPQSNAKVSVLIYSFIRFGRRYYGRFRAEIKYVVKCGFGHCCRLPRGNTISEPMSCLTPMVTGSEWDYYYQERTHPLYSQSLSPIRNIAISTLLYKHREPCQRTTWYDVESTRDPSVNGERLCYGAIT
jgi:hypothetical protein